MNVSFLTVMVHQETINVPQSDGVVHVRLLQQGLANLHGKPRVLLAQSAEQREGGTLTLSYSWKTHLEKKYVGFFFLFFYLRARTYFFIRTTLCFRRVNLGSSRSDDGSWPLVRHLAASVKMFIASS